jgi:DNA-binding MarR family transcriptional regulator
VLLDIDEHAHLTMGQLALNLKLDQSTLSRTVDGLVRKKLVARMRDDSDRRLVWIRLTEDGASTCEEIHEVNDEYCLQVFENIPPSERAALLQVFENIPPSERAALVRNFEALIQAYLDHEASVLECG